MHLIVSNLWIFYFILLKSEKSHSWLALSYCDTLLSYLCIHSIVGRLGSCCFFARLVGVGLERILKIHLSHRNICWHRFVILIRWNLYFKWDVLLFVAIKATTHNGNNYDSADDTTRYCTSTAAFLSLGCDFRHCIKILFTNFFIFDVAAVCDWRTFLFLIIFILLFLLLLLLLFLLLLLLLFLLLLLLFNFFLLLFNFLFLLFNFFLLLLDFFSLFYWQWFIFASVHNFKLSFEAEVPLDEVFLRLTLTILVIVLFDGGTVGTALGDDWEGRFAKLCNRRAFSRWCPIIVADEDTKSEFGVFAPRVDPIATRIIKKTGALEHFHRFKTIFIWNVSAIDGLDIISHGF